MSELWEPGAEPGQYLRILETAPDAMIVVEKPGRILYANLQVEALFGHKREALLGRTMEMLLPERSRAMHALYLDRFFEAPQLRVMGSGRELFGLRADATEVLIEVSLSPVYTSHGILVSAAIRDLTDRKRIEGAARLNSERLAAAVESIQDAFALYDAQRNLVQCNSVFRRLLGEEVAGAPLGMSYDAILAEMLAQARFEEEGAREQFLAERRREQGLATSTFELRTQDGRSLRVSDRHTPEGGLVQTVWDRTEDVAREQELRVARAAAEAGSAAKSEFLSSMSHELRTPLNAILGFAQLLKRDKREPLSLRHAERVEQILRGGEHLRRLIDDILDLARIEAGAVSLSVEPVDVGEVLSDVCQTLVPFSARNDVTVLSPSVPLPSPKAAVDRTRFQQILMNLGSNAIKYNHLGGTVSFRAELRPGGRVRVTVADTGLGIPEEKQDKLFQPFQRAGQETGPIEGTGIGLVITRRLARMMNGEVGFTSKAGEGSEFWVEVPLDNSAPVHPPAEPLRHHGALSEGPRRLVLYVEDNPANVAFLRDVLSSFEALELLNAPNAELGLELLRARRPAVVLMDINLPGMSGIEALRAIQQDPATRELPVIALTAAATERDRRHGEQAGFFRYLTKPVRVEELEEGIEAALARTEG